MSSHPHFRLKLVVIALTLLYSGLSKAEDVVYNPITPSALPALSQAENTTGNVFFPLYPRLNITGGAGNNNFGAADVMAPLFGSTDAIVYTDVDGQMGKGKSNRLSLGIGARDAINDDVMWGGYAFVDRSKSNDADGGAHWTVFNPGVEFMTNHWDGRINAYIPNGDKQNVQGPFFGDQVGRPDAVTFTDHDQFSRLFDKVEEIGNGVDADVGYTFTSLKRFRVHGGGYYFQMSNDFTNNDALHPISKTNSLSGGEIGAEMPINNYATLQFDDSYDDVQKNSAVVSLRFTLGGIDKFSNEPTVQDRILDPVYRHLGGLNTNTGMPSVNTLVETDSMPVLEHQNVWFFNANSGVAFDPAAGNNNCTFEHPCIGTNFNQTNVNTINSIDPNANFYFTPGTYAFSSAGRLSLNSGQSMYGRNNDYTLAASSASGFPTFVGGLNPQGNNTLDSFALINNAGAQTIGIHVSSANNVLMNNLQIGQSNVAESYTNSIQLDNAQNITVQHSTIQAVTNAGSANATILSANNSSGITFNNNTSTLTNNAAAGNTKGILAVNSTVTANTNTFTLSGGSRITGLWNQTGGTINATGNTFNISNASGIFSSGALNNDTGTINLTSNTFNISAVSPVGLANIGAGGAVGTINATGNIFNLTAFSIGGTNSVTGISNQGTGTINATANLFNLTALGAFGISNVTAVSNDGTGSININNNVFNLTSMNLFGISHMTGIHNPSGTVAGNNNTFNFLGFANTKTCGTFTSGTGNIFNGGCT